MQHRSQHHIELKTSEPLPKGVPALWAKTVNAAGPNGVMGETDILQGRELLSVKFYCVKGKSGYHYVIPLTRDLEESEADTIANAWAYVYPKGDFVINWSQRDSVDHKIETVQHRVTDSIVELAAKTYHNRWQQDKINEGWNFGHKLDARNRKHPMLQPWESLPEKYKVQERERFRTLLRVLEGLNLKISRG